MAFGKDQDPMIGKRFPHQDPTKGGRKPSIKNQLKDLLKADGQVTIPASQVIRINDDGSVLMKLPTEMQLAMKLNSIAMSGKNNNTLKAIQMIMEQIDGKPNQSIKVENEAPIFKVYDARK